MKLSSSISVGILIFIFSCSVEQEKIDYGKESCYFCKMTIVDKQHAAELITSKGKAYKFDAIECMINYINKNDVDASLLFVCDYSNPGKLIPANTATFLVSDEIPSPMGAFLSAFSTKQEAEGIQNEKTGSIYSWESIQTQIK